MLPEVSSSALQRADEYREKFLSADPFKHVVIEDFFEPCFAEELLTQFPSFDTSLARNEAGRTGGKAVQTNIRTIGPAYQRLYESIAGPAFLDFVSRLSGIPDLILDPKMFGGGTHDNLHGQELDPHVDFNYDEARQLHRRLNLIVYLNKEWRSEWGGALEIHSNPRKPFENRISSYDPLFNRCVMFETNEYSWHGFPKIHLPEDKRHLSRKSISIYLYTRERPPEEVAPLHATFYVQRPLPARFAAGHVLTEDDVRELHALLIRRDQWIELYQKMELDKNRDLAELTAALERTRAQTPVPLTGYALLDGPVEGLYGDGWAASKVVLRVKPLQPITGFLLRGFRPESAPPARINGVSASGEFEIRMPAADQIEVVTHHDPNWSASTGDNRDLAFVLIELRALHG